MARRRKTKSDTDGMPPRKPNGKALVPQMRPVSRKTSFAKLRSCKCFPEVHERVVQGYSPAEIARWVQDEKGEYTDAAHASLKIIIDRYRKSLPPGELAKHRLSSDHKAALEEIEENIDTIREFIKLYRKQMARIDVDMKTEEKIGKLFPTMTQEMRVAGEFLRGIAQMQMDLGIKDRHLGTVDVEARMLDEIDERYEGTAVGKVFADPKKRRKLLNIAEHALSLADRGIGMRRGEDGSFELVSGDDAGTEDLH